MKRQRGKLYTFLAGFLFFISLSSLAFGKTVVSWFPETISESLENGDNSTREVKFVCGKDFRDVDLWLVPELQSHIDINPNRFSTVTGGQEYTVQLSFKTSCDEIPSSYEGTLHFRVGKRTYPDNLKISLMVVNPQGLIPHTVQFHSTDPEIVFLNQDTTVKISIYVVPDPYLMASEVRLLRVDESGSMIGDLGRMYDDGSHGDAQAADNIFTTDLVFNESVPGLIGLCASVSFLDIPCPIFSDIFPIRAYVESDPDQRRTRIAHDLSQGNIEGAKEGFAKSRMNMEIIENMDATSRNRLANYIKNARLTEENENYRVYSGEYVDPAGNTHTLEFMMSRNSVGEWIIISW